MACYSATRKKGILPLATTWMDFEGILLSEVSQAEKGKYWTVRYHLCVESKKAKLVDTECRVVVIGNWGDLEQSVQACS